MKLLEYGQFKKILMNVHAQSECIEDALQFSRKWGAIKQNLSSKKNTQLIEFLAVPTLINLGLTFEE